ncbi:hypothetical protein [uncultured Dialister sp.]|uniref:hypothetical protein n=1 Tax=uncultured Dialister sp. TaxID=278064 RepID=UPI0026DC4A24|nr:hypothetical protein [uncultured Dialister sp.]
MKDKYVHLSAFKDLLCDVYNVMERLDHAIEHSEYGVPERTAMEWIAEKLKDTIDRAELQVENAEPGDEPEIESACGDCTHDVREALGLSGGKEEEPESLNALSTKLLKDSLDELMQSAAACSVSDSLSKEERACYQAKEDAYEVALSLIEINLAWQKKLAEAGKKA